MLFQAKKAKAFPPWLFVVASKASYSCSAGVSIVAAGTSVAGALGRTVSICELTSLFGVPSFEFFGRVMLEIKQSTTKMPPIVQVAFSRKSVV